MKPALNVVPRDALAGDTVPAPLDVAWEPTLPGRRRPLSSWNEYMAMASRVVGRFFGQFRQEQFDYEHPTRLQPGTPRRLRKPYKAVVAYTEWGPADAPVLLCCGGVANVAMRFHYLASDLSERYRVVCMDWLGRGRSGWLAAVVLLALIAVWPVPHDYRVLFLLVVIWAVVELGLLSGEQGANRFGPNPGRTAPA